MRKFYAIALAGVLAAPASVSWAMGPAQIRVEGSSHEKSHERTGEDPLTTYEHQVKGPIVMIDHRTGSVHLDVPDGPMKLHFPPTAVRDLEEGDSITAQFTVNKWSPESKGAVRAFDMPAGRGAHRMTGTVTKVDQETGWIQVQSGEHLLELCVPGAALGTLSKGELVAVDLAFSRAK